MSSSVAGAWPPKAQMCPTLSAGHFRCTKRRTQTDAAHPLQCQQHGCLSSHAVANEDAGHQAQLWQEALKVLTHGLVACIWTMGAVAMVPSIHCQHLGCRVKQEYRNGGTLIIDSEKPGKL